MSLQDEGDVEDAEGVADGARAEDAVEPDGGEGDAAHGRPHLNKNKMN